MSINSSSCTRASRKNTKKSQLRSNLQRRKTTVLQLRYLPIHSQLTISRQLSSSGQPSALSVAGPAAGVYAPNKRTNIFIYICVDRLCIQPSLFPLLRLLIFRLTSDVSATIQFFFCFWAKLSLASSMEETPNKARLIYRWKEETGEIDEGDMEETGPSDSSEKTTAILVGDRWWPQAAQQEGDQISYTFVRNL